MRRLLTLTGCFVLMGAAFLLTRQAKHWGSPLRVTPPAIEFGNLEHGVTATREAVVTNTSRQPITLSEFRADCGCLTVRVNGETEAPRQVVLQPGQSANLSCGFMTSGYRGFIQRSFRFRTSLTSDPVIVVPMSMNVIGGLFAVPEEVQFGQLTLHDRPRVTVTVTDTAKTSRTIVAVDNGTNRKLGIEWSRAGEDATDVRHQIHISLDDLEVGDISGHLGVRMSDESENECLRIPVRGHRQPRYVVSPSVVVLPRAGGNGKIFHADVVLTNTLGIPFRVATTSDNDAIVAQASSELSTAHRVRIELARRESLSTPGKVQLMANEPTSARESAPVIVRPNPN